MTAFLKKSVVLRAERLNHPFSEEHEVMVGALAQSGEAPAIAEDWHRVLFDGSPNAILVIDPQTDIVIGANPEACRVLGFTKAEICGLRLATILDASDPRYVAALEERARFGAFRGEFTCRRADGVHFPVDVSSSVFSSPSGHLLAGVFLKDITERRSLENQLLKLAAIVESATDAIIGGEVDGVVQSWNRSAEALYGYPAAEMLGRYPTILTPPSHEADKQLISDRIAQGRALLQYETQCLTKDGRLIDISLTAFPIKNTVGEIIGTATLAHDISQRKAMEQALRLSEARYRMLANNARDVIWTIDLNGVVTYVSPSVRQMYGYMTDELEWNSLFDWLTPATAIAVKAKFDGLIARTAASHTPESDRFEYELCRKDGSRLWVEVIASTLHNALGDLTGFMAVMRDTTERRAMETEIRQLNATLEERVADRTTRLETALADLKLADKAKDEFLAAVTHELRTPLTGVLAMVDALEEQYGETFDERQRRYVTKIRESGNRLRVLVDSILQYTGLIAGTVNLQPEHCRLADLWTASTRVIRTSIDQKGLALSCEIEPADLEVVIDKNAVVRVLQNLLENAAKFTPQGGQIGFSAEVDQAHANVQLVVWDTGIGIDPIDQARIFRPFVQLDSTLSRRYEGIGLGLAYAARMVSLLGGTLAVESALGAGCRFIVTLPRANH